MENLAYLHLALTYQDPETTELISLAKLFRQTVAPNWSRFSGKSWNFLIPLVISLSLLNTISSVLAQQVPPSLSPSEAAFFGQQNQQQTTTQQTSASLNEPFEENKFQLVQIQTINNTIISTNSVPTNIIPVIKKRQNPNFLTKGDEGEEVRVLQQRLAIAGFYYGNPTGVFGPITQEAVKRFQKAYNLQIDGVVGKSTQAKLTNLTTTNDKVANNKLEQKSDNSHTLSLGDRGEAVRILQEQLIKAGFFSGEPNGYYGSYTVDAVSRFQKKHKLEVNGLAGSTTRSKLHSVIKTSSNSDFTTLELQQRLHKLGFYKGPINGTMADDTKKALDRAQKFYGISLADIKSGSL